MPRGTGAGVRKPARNPRDFGAVAVPGSLWVFGQLVWDERRCDRSGWACVWGARTSRQVAMVRARMTRRHFVTFAVLTCCPWPALTQSLPTIRVTKDPNCGCCGGWVDHLRAAGFPVEVNDTPQVNRIKANLGIPDELWACHTAESGPYVIEGHVPASAIQRLLQERPQAIGLAVPAMPVGSPGMEVAGVPPVEYTVFLFDTAGHRPYARFRGTSEPSKNSN
jgi:hypothetical protein